MARSHSAAERMPLPGTQLWRPVVAGSDSGETSIVRPKAAYLRAVSPQGHKMETVKLNENAATKGQAFSVLGIDVDWQNRCEHCTSPLDVAAFRYKCCGLYYACVKCHEVLAEHEIVLWDKTDYETLGVLCGICRTEFTIGESISQAMIDVRTARPYSIEKSRLRCSNAIRGKAALNDRRQSTVSLVPTSLACSLHAETESGHGIA
jgi:uncharacterized CHY-type Zn-finger protein